MVRVILTVILLWYTYISLGQTYHPLPDSNATWEVSENYLINISPYQVGWNHYEYYIDGDTIINNVVYHKVNDLWNNDVFVGSIREDSSKTIYFKKADETLFYLRSIPDTEVVLYQFGRLVGDTIPISDPWTDHRIITSIDSILVGSGYRKRHLVSGGGLLQNDYWIEGIGSVAGLFGSYLGEFENGWTLECFHEESVYFPDSSTCLTVSIPEKSTNIHFKVYPNPVNDKLYIELNQSKSSQVEIYSGIGVLKRTFKNVSGDVQVDLSSYESGIYLIKVSNIEEVGLKKVVKN